MARGRGGFWRGSATVLAAVVALGLVGAGAAVALFPAERVARDLEAFLSTTLDRRVEIRGGASLTFWPVLGVRAEDVFVANLEGGRAEHLLKARALSAGVALRPLLRGRVELSRIDLVAPEVALETLKDGAVNWTFSTETDEARPLPDWLKDARLESLVVQDGTFSLFDARDGATNAVSDVDATLRLVSLDSPAALTSSFVYRGKPVKADAALGDPRAWLEGRPTPIKLDVKAELITARLDGRLTPQTGAIEGALDARGPSLTRLGAWFGEAAKPGRGLGAFGVSGRAVREGEEVRLSRARLTLEHLTATGDLAVRMGGARPYARGALDFGALDLNPWLAPQGAAPKGVDVGAGWSTTPIDLGGLSVLDGDLELSARSVAFQRMKFGPTRLGVTLRGGAADVLIRRLEAYGGSGSGRLKLAPAGRGAAISGALKVAGVSARPFLTDAAGFDKIEGALSLDLALAAVGRSQAELVRDLDGRIAFKAADGAYRGVDLAKIAREIKAALSGGVVGPGAKTDFAEFAASFTVSNGVMATDGLRLLNPFVRLSGVGKVDLGARTLDFSLTPRAVGSARGQGGAFDAKGLGVPFRAQGPWSDVKFAPDLGGLAEKALRQELGEQLGLDPSARPEDLLGGLLNRGRREPEAAPAEKSEPDQPAPRDPLQDLIGRLPRR